MVVMAHRLAAPGDAGEVLYIRCDLDYLPIGYIVLELYCLEDIGLGNFFHKGLGVGAKYGSQARYYLGQPLAVCLGRYNGYSERIHICGQGSIVIAVINLSPQSRYLGGSPGYCPRPVLILHPPGHLHGEEISGENSEHCADNKDQKKHPLLFYTLILKRIVAHFPPQISFGIRCVFFRIR